MSDLVAALTPGRYTVIEQGVVTSTSPLQVTVGASTVPVTVPRLASYTPVIGHRVVVAVTGADRVILGQVV